MADIRIKDLATTATTTASDDFMAVDGTTNGTRKMNAAAPAFLTSVTTPSLTSPASTNLTLAGGAGNSSIILTPAGTGGVGIGTTTPASFVELKAAAGSLQQRFTDVTAGLIGFIGGANGILSGAAANTMGVRAENGLFLSGAGHTNVHLVLNSSSQVLIGTTDSTGLTGAGGLKIASTTAGSYNAGALVVAGGLATGADSFFGGSRLLAQKDQNAPTRIQARNDNSGTSAQSQVSATLGDFTTYTAMGSLSAGFTTSGLFAANSGYIASNATAGLNLFTVGATSLTLGTNSTAALTLASGGAATFAGAVTVGGKITSAVSTATGYNQLYDTTGLTTGRGAFAITSTGAGLAFGVESSVGGTSFTGSTAYASYFGTTTATPIHFVTNSVIRQTIDSTGAATFAGAVTVNGTGTFGSSFGKVIINQWSDATNYGAITLNGNTTVAGSLGIGGGASGDSTLYFNAPTGGSIQARINGTAALTIASTSAATFAGAVTIAGNVGFYNASPVAKPTSVAVTAAAIHAALVTLNLIAA